MAKHITKGRKKTPKAPGSSEIPAGATRKALDRPVQPEAGPPGSGAGPRHAADDIGSEGETFGRTDTTITPASPPAEAEDSLEKGPPYAGSSGGAVGGFPAQMRSAEGSHLHTDAERDQSLASDETNPMPLASEPHGDMIRLTGDAAIEYAEKQGLLLNKHPDSLTGPRRNLTVAEAQGIADDDPELIWVDVARQDYYSGPPTIFEPES